MFIKDNDHLKNHLGFIINKHINSIDEEELLPIETYIHYLNSLQPEKVDQFTWNLRDNIQLLYENNFMQFIADNKNTLGIGYLPKWLEQSTTKEFHNYIKGLNDISGVYSFWTKNNITTLYVGVSNNLANRIISSYRERFSKYNKPIYLRTISGISYSDACVLETYYITKLNPVLNSVANSKDELTININYGQDWSEPILCNKVKDNLKS